MDHAITQNRIIFIGGGNIAEAIFSRLDPDHNTIIVVQRNHDKLKRLKSQYPKITCLNQLEFEALATDLVILTVKPQDARITCQTLKPLLNKANIISVMAGITTATLNTLLDNNQITLAMPNILASCGYGSTGIFFKETVAQNYQKIILEIFNNLGKTYLVKLEDDINKITAIAGSSPAYLLYFLECMIQASNALGFDENISQEIALQIAKGTVALIEANLDSNTLQELRQRITSNKGTTAAAIESFEKSDLINTVNKAVTACYHRAQELRI